MAVKEIEVSNPQADILESLCSRNLFQSGVGSGKSHALTICSGDFIINYPHMRGFIGANTYQQLSKSTLDRVFKVWQLYFGWKRDVHYVVNKVPPKSWIKYGTQLENYDKTISFDNGALIFTASLDNYHAIDGTEFGWAMLDETKDTPEEAVKEVIIARLRQPGMWINAKGELCTVNCGASFNPLYIFTSPAKVDWINEWFGISDQDTIEEIHRHIFSKTDYYVQEKNDMKVVISSTYHNEHNLPNGYINSLIKDYAGNPTRLNMLVYGSPVAKTGGEYWTAFDRMVHVKPVQFEPSMAVHAGFDFNVTPYNTLILSHVVKLPTGKFQIRVFDEICLTSPRNNTEAVCTEAMEKYISKSAGVYYTGDESGKKRDTRGNEHDFHIIERVLRKKIHNASNRRFRSNPGLTASRDFINKLLAGGFDAIEPTIIDPRCKNLIKDLEFLKEGPDGGPLKQHAKDSNGAKYEKYGHCSDAFKYLHIATFKAFFDRA